MANHPNIGVIYAKTTLYASQRYAYANAYLNKSQDKHSWIRNVMLEHKNSDITSTLQEWPKVTDNAVAAQFCPPQNAYRSPPNGNLFKAVFDVMLLLEAKWPSNQNILIADTILAKPCPWPGFKVSEQNTF